MEDRLSWIADRLGDRVASVVDVTQSWETATRTRIVTMQSGDRVVVQSMGDRAALARRLRLSQRLPIVAPWLPIPEIRLAELAAPNPVIVTRFIAGTSGREMLATDAQAQVLGRLLGGLLGDLRRVPISGLHLHGTWSRPDQLLAAARRWTEGARDVLGATAPQVLAELLAEAWELLSAEPVVFAHGDLAPVNVVVRNGRLVALLDLEHARIAPALFDAARVRWIIRHHHPERWPALRDPFLAAAGLDQGTRTLRTLNLLAALQCLEALHRIPKGRTSTRLECATNLAEVLAWDPD